MKEVIIMPGIGGSGEEHWQSRWQKAEPRARRFAPSSWDLPMLDDWIEALDREMAKSAEPPLIVAHSLACLLVAYWAQRTSHSAAGAFLVAVPDPASPVFPVEAAGFGHPPTLALPFPSMVVASSSDPYGTLAYSYALAARWGSAFIDAGAHGHLNGSSGLGDWPEGRAALAAFEAGLG
ncbi:RBBP9/YdeN family alpha/beta hydrolase [Rhizobium sp. Root1203]|uniref:RBBP9/YdeN family alpha/beta hydrolase n=1 Tax=Rhizobium sp. Root1203 TaxID=1736427 RepID=UPI0009EADD08|nr:alpha/beta hydrolase [Rhizobium sp. Root1203]